jgi:hypothetical protein
LSPPRFFQGGWINLWIQKCILDNKKSESFLRLYPRMKKYYFVYKLDLIYIFKYFLTHRFYHISLELSYSIFLHCSIIFITSFIWITNSSVNDILCYHIKYLPLTLEAFYSMLSTKYLVLYFLKQLWRITMHKMSWIWPVAKKFFH